MERSGREVVGVGRRRKGKGSDNMKISRITWFWWLSGMEFAKSDYDDCEEGKQTKIRLHCFDHLSNAMVSPRTQPIQRLEHKEPPCVMEINGEVCCTSESR